MPLPLNLIREGGEGVTSKSSTLPVPPLSQWLVQPRQSTKDWVRNLTMDLCLTTMDIDSSQSGGWEPQKRLPAWLGSDGSSCLQTAGLPLCPHRAERW